MPNRRLLIRLFRSLVSDRRHTPDLSWITPGLSISGTLHPRHFERLFQLGIGAIVDLREEGKDDEELLGRYGIRLLHLPVRDHWPPSQAQLVTGTRWLADQRAEGRKTLIHCKEGVGRSVVLACCVLKHQGHDLASAMHLVKAPAGEWPSTDDRWKASSDSLCRSNCCRGPFGSQARLRRLAP